MSQGPEYTENPNGVLYPSDVVPPVDQLSDADEGVFRTYEEAEARVERREAEQRMSYTESLEWGRAANARARELARENEELRSRLGIEPGAASEGVATGESEAPQASRGNVDDIDARVGGSSDPLNDLVQEAVRALLPELLREVLPRPRAIEVFIPGEGRARVDAAEVVARTYSALVDTVAQLAAASKRVPVEDGYWASGVEDETASLLAQVAMASPRRPKAVNHSRSLLEDCSRAYVRVVVV